jgi:hypothetical protein
VFFLFIGCCHQGEHHITIYNNSEKVYIVTFINSRNGFNYYLKKNHSSDIGIGLGKQDSEIVDKHPTEKKLLLLCILTR